MERHPDDSSELHVVALNLVASLKDTVSHSSFTVSCTLPPDMPDIKPVVANEDVTRLRVRRKMDFFLQMTQLPIRLDHTQLTTEALIVQYAANTLGEDKKVFSEVFAKQRDRVLRLMKYIIRLEEYSPVGIDIAKLLVRRIPECLYPKEHLADAIVDVRAAARNYQVALLLTEEASFYAQKLRN